MDNSGESIGPEHILGQADRAVKGLMGAAARLWSGSRQTFVTMRREQPSTAAVCRTVHGGAQRQTIYWINAEISDGDSSPCGRDRLGIGFRATTDHSELQSREHPYHARAGGEAWTRPVSHRGNHRRHDEARGID